MKAYKCLDCGNTFKSQGIGPHQRSKGHSGKEQVEVPKSFPPKRQARVVALQSLPEPSRPTHTLNLTILPYLVVEDENGRRGILEWDSAES